MQISVTHRLGEEWEEKIRERAKIHPVKIYKNSGIFISRGENDTAIEML